MGPYSFVEPLSKVAYVLRSKFGNLTARVHVMKVQHFMRTSLKRPIHRMAYIMKSEEMFSNITKKTLSVDETLYLYFIGSTV